MEKVRPRDKEFYVSNPVLYEAYKKWYAEIDAAVAEGREEPPIPNFIAESIVKICTKLSYRPNFINYSYREEMIGDAIENCIRTARSFNINKGSNPFAYITTIAWNAYLRRIETEKREVYVKGKLISDLPIDEIVSISENDTDTMNNASFIEFLRENSYIVGMELSSMKKKRKGVKLAEETLNEFMDDAADIPLEESIDNNDQE